MIETQHSLTATALSLFALMGLSGIVFCWGKKIPGKGSWLIWVGILLIFAAISVDSGLLLQEGFQLKAWGSGWVLPKDEMSAITVGVMHDLVGTAMAVLTLLISGVFLMNQSRVSKEPHSERIHAALGAATVGVILSWNSLTPWLGLVGLLIAVLGGVMVYGGRWDTEAEAKIASRFLFERFSGILLALLGICILIISRTALAFHSLNHWASDGESQNTFCGAFLLAAGLFIQLQPFPFLGGLIMQSNLFSMARILLLQVFPAWARFAFFVRFYSEFKAIGIFPGLGWIALGSAFLSLLSGLFQKQWRQSLRLWLASGFSVSLGILAFTGPFASMAMLFGMSLCALSFAGAASTLNESHAGDSAEKEATRSSIWVKAILFLSICAGTGVIGFISAAGGVRGMAQALEAGTFNATLFVVVFFIFVLLGWKMAWKTSKMPVKEEVTYISLFSLLLCQFLSFGMIWTGSIANEVDFSESTHIWRSLLNEFFQKESVTLPSPETFYTASGLYWGALSIGVIAAYWTAGRREDRWMKFFEFAPRLSAFLSQVYRMDQVALRVIAGIRAIGKWVEGVIDFKFWTQIIPDGLAGAVKTVTLVMNRIDHQLHTGIHTGLRKTVETPARFLQFIHLGDVRWYLLFALGSGFAILAHFLNL